MSNGVFQAFQPSNDEIDTRFQLELNQFRQIHNQLFAWILPIQWFAFIILAAIISPLTWKGDHSTLHPHLLAALFLGGLVSLYPVVLAKRRSRDTSTRYVVAIAQMLMSGLLVHLCGGRIEAHFHIFASLALLAFYRDNKLLWLSAAIIGADHLVRGIFWPRSVFGVDEALPALRALEHVAWVSLEVIALSFSNRRSHREMKGIVSRQIVLENTETVLEHQVANRTRELRESEQKARKRFDNAPIGMYHCDSAGKLLSVNPAMANLLGYHSAEEMLEEIETLEQIQCRESTTTESWLEAVLENQGYRHRDSQWRHQNGTAIPIRESTKVMPAVDGSHPGIEGIVEDLTEFRELEERYLHSRKVQAIGQLTTGIAHDFNTFLTSIVGFSDLIIDCPDTPERIRDRVKDIHTSAGRATRLTSQLLAFSKKQTFQPEAFQLPASVENMKGLLQHLVGDSIAIRVKTTENIETVYADPLQIEQVVLNLAANARDAMPRGGEITIEVGETTLSEGFMSYCGEATPGTYVVMSMSDTGSGITEEVRKQMFDPFFTTKGTSGTGLGLATCIGIIKQSGGHLTLDSGSENGCTFRVYLPTSKDLSTKAKPTGLGSATEPNCQSLSNGVRRILFAEDEMMARKLGVLALSSLGYQVVEASNGADALEKFITQQDERKFELVITDIMMPVMGGMELAERISGISPGTPIIYTSGYTNEAIASTDDLKEGHHFLQKPYPIKLLGSKITEALNLSVA